MRKLMLLAPAAVLLTAAGPVPPYEQRGRQNADCRANEPGPALRVEVLGLKDTRGRLRVELYPATQQDYLADDTDLIAAGKVFKRIEVPVPHQPNPVLCIRAPRPGAYAIAVVHDRDSNRKFSPFTDGVTATGNQPNLGRSKPRLANATVQIGQGVTQARATMQYLRGFGFAPLAR